MFCSAESAAPGAGTTPRCQTRQDNRRKSSVHILSNYGQLRNSTAQMRFERQASKPKTLDSHSGFFFFFFFEKPLRPSDRLTRLREKEIKRKRLKSEGNLLKLCFSVTGAPAVARLSLPQLTRLAVAPQTGEAKGFISAEAPQATVAVGVPDQRLGSRWLKGKD